MKNRFGKMMTLLIALMLAMLALAACGSGGEDPDEVRESPPVKAEPVQDEPETDDVYITEPVELPAHKDEGDDDWYFIDENGLCDGHYNYRKGKVYFLLGGSMSAEVYLIKDGELIQQ